MRLSASGDIRGLASQVALLVKNQEMQAGSLVGKIPRRRKWQATAGFLPETSHGQNSLAGYSPWGHKELDTTEVT